MKALAEETFIRPQADPVCQSSKTTLELRWKVEERHRLREAVKLFLGASLLLQLKLFLILPHWPLITFISLLKSNSFSWDLDIAPNQKQKQTNKKPHKYGAREMAQWLTACAALVRDPSTVPKTSLEQLTTA